MTSSRERILARVRQNGAKNRETDQAISEAPLDTTLKDETKHTANAERTNTFIDQAEKSAATVHRVAHYEEAIQIISTRHESATPSPNLYIAPGISWPFTKPHNTNTYPKADGSWGICQAWRAIANTGTIVVTTQDCSTKLLFLVETLFVLLDAADILDRQEWVWQHLRDRFASQLPRTVHLITGPSRTADVEQTLQLGAHGPRKVEYIIYNLPE